MSPPTTPVRSIAELVASAEGRSLLEARGVHTDPDRFRAALRPPADEALAERLGLPAGRPIVYVGQQVAADYQRATAAKFVAARELCGDSVECVLLWHDMDRAGSDRRGLRVVLHLGGQPTGVWLAHKSMADREPRFVPAEPERFEELVQRACKAGDGLPREVRVVARERIGRLQAACRDAAPQTLAETGRALLTHLLAEHLDVRLPSLFVSELAQAGLMRGRLLDVLEHLDAVVEAFNGAIAALEADGIDPQVRPLAPNWLPLWYSCPDAGRRVRLVREEHGSDRYAVSECRCGRTHRFHLGSGTPSLAALEATGRWSPDVLLPALHDHLASGYVAGRSTALYGIVVREVLRKALEVEPTPAFVPPALADPGEPAPDPDSLLHAYLVA